MVWLELSSNGIKRASLAIFVISFFILILTLTSNFGHFEVFSKDNIVINGRGQNLTTQCLPIITQNITDDNELETKNSTLRGIITQNITKNDQLETKNSTQSNTGSTNSSSSSTKNHHADKFLDGLIPSGFNKGSCLSRYQSYLYSKVSPNKPSPYLISKLRNYEDLHRRCGPHTRAYKRTMVHLNRFKSNVTTTTTTRSCKYIVWIHVNGLGNRMVSMAATFLYAILTDRVLLVKFDDDMVGLFCEPFLNSSWLLPNGKEFPFSTDDNGKKDFETYDSVMKRDRKNNSKELLLPSVMHLKIEHTDDEHEMFFSCDHNQHLLQKVPIMILRSDQYFVPSLFMGPSFGQELRKMFPNKDTVFHHLGRYLFFPSNDVWGPIKRFYQAYLAKADEKIGIQVRVFDPKFTSHQTITNQILTCAQKNKILPNFAAKDSKDSPWKNQTLKSVLVASLYREYGENLRTMYLNTPSVTGEIIGVYQPSHEEHQKFGDNLQNKKALTEMYLLSLCDVLVTSSLSTFGYVAQGLGGLKPWVLYKIQDNKPPDSPCVQDVSMEPCYHIPPKLDCMEKPIDDDVGKAFPYMRRCVDYYFGVKLVNDLQ